MIRRPGDHSQLLTSSIVILVSVEDLSRHHGTWVLRAQGGVDDVVMGRHHSVEAIESRACREHPVVGAGGRLLIALMRRLLNGEFKRSSAGYGGNRFILYDMVTVSKSMSAVLAHVASDA